MSPQTPSCLFFTFFLRVIVSITPSHWSKQWSLWMLWLPANFVCDRFRLWVVLWFLLSHSPLFLSLYYSLWPFGFFLVEAQSSRTDHLFPTSSGIQDYGPRDSVLRDQIMKWSLRSRNRFVKCSWSDHEQITKYPSFSLFFLFQNLHRSLPCPV